MVTFFVTLVGVAAMMAVLSTGQLSPRVAPSTPPPPQGVLIWSADTETGDVSQWTQDQFGEAVFNSGTGSIVATSNTAHSGSHSLKMSISGADGQTQAARILRWHDTPVEGYYSVWLNFPRVYRPRAWWNVLQIKSQDPDRNVPVFVLNVGSRDDRAMDFYLWDGLTGKSYSQINHVDIPVRQWTHVELFLKRATDRTGRITIWEDGTLLFDVDEVQTAIGDNTHFGIGNYTDDLTPSDATIYADDAEIHAVRSLQASPFIQAGMSGP